MRLKISRLSAPAAVSEYLNEPEEIRPRRNQAGAHRWCHTAWT